MREMAMFTMLLLASWVLCPLGAVLGATGDGTPTAGMVELSVVERQGVARLGEPVTFGVPLPKGELQNTQQVRLMRDGAEIPAQFRATGLWRPDESIRWLLVDFQADIDANATQRPIASTTSHTPNANSALKGAITRKAPKPVATPLPPRKRSHIGKQ